MTSLTFDLALEADPTNGAEKEDMHEGQKNLCFSTEADLELQLYQWIPARSSGNDSALKISNSSNNA